MNKFKVGDKVAQSVWLVTQIATPTSGRNCLAAHWLSVLFTMMKLPRLFLPEFPEMVAGNGILMICGWCLNPLLHKCGTDSSYICSLKSGAHRILPHTRQDLLKGMSAVEAAEGGES